MQVRPSFRLQFVDQKLERHLLVLMRGEHPLSNPPNQFAQARAAAAVWVRMTSRLTKNPIRRLHVGMAAIGGGNAHRHVVLSGISRQESLQTGQDRLGQGRPH